MNKRRERPSVNEEVEKVEKDILSRLYQTTRERKTSQEYDNLRKELEKVKEEFLKKVGEDRRGELEKVTDTIYTMNSILSKEDFCIGFEMAVRLFIESIYKERDDQE